MAKIKWLSRRISAPGPYMCLCLSEEAFLSAVKSIRSTTNASWLNPHANATAHFFQGGDGLTAIVCLGEQSDRSDVEIYGILVHEAVHAWQEWCAHYGERNPGSEQEAYAIQSLSQTLIEEYQRQISLATSSA